QQMTVHRLDAAVAGQLPYRVRLPPVGQRREQRQRYPDQQRDERPPQFADESAAVGEHPYRDRQAGAEQQQVVRHRQRDDQRGGDQGLLADLAYRPAQHGHQQREQPQPGDLADEAEQQQRYAVGEVQVPDRGGGQRQERPDPKPGPGDPAGRPQHA